MNDARNNLEKNDALKFEPYEIQSGLNRVRYAELLIKQLPADHDGRNTWLLNYGGDKIATSNINLLDYSDLQTIADNLANERNDLRNQLDEATDLVSDLRTELDVQVNNNLLTIHEHARAMWLANERYDSLQGQFVNEQDVNGEWKRLALKAMHEAEKMENNRDEWAAHFYGMRSFLNPMAFMLLMGLFITVAYAMGFAKPIVDGRAWFAGVMDWITWF